jgi:conjugal transfer pilus assembly protein TraW
MSCASALLRAIARYWQGAALEPLPPATEVRVREIDPTISAEHDLVLPDGKVLARAGDRINPLDRMPFRQRLVVFDATDPAQVQTAQDLGAKTGVARVIYLASNLERTAGWEAFNDVQSQLGAPLYLLTADVRERFALQRVPASVEAKGRVFLVTEVPPQAATGP